MSDINQLIQTVSDLINIKSMHAYPEQIKKCMDYAANYLADTNLEIKHIDSNGVSNLVVTKTGIKNPDVFLCGHMDVVDAPDNLFQTQIKDDWLYGRGALDMKSGNAINLILMKELAKTHNIGLMFTGDEEIGGFNGTKILLDQGYTCKVALLPDGGLNPANIMYKAKGVLFIELNALGTPCHGSRPWQGNNAINILMKSIDIVQNLFTPIANHDQEHWTATCNVGKIQGGDSTNTVAANAQAICDIRFTETDDPQELLQRIQASLPDGVQAKEIISAPCTYVAPDNQYVQHYQDSIRKQNLEPNFTLDHGSSDARFFSAHNIPVIVNQPLGEGHHTNNEKVYIPSLLTYYNIVKDFLDQVAKS